jgi:hypothetical protein
MALYTGRERYANDNRRTQQRADNNRRNVDNRLQAMFLEKKKTMRDNKTKMEKFINAMPEGFDAQILPEKYKPGLDKFLKEGKRKYADAAMQIGNYEVGSDDYLFFKEQMDNVSNAFKSAKAQVDLFGGNKKDLGIDLSSGNFSKGNNTGEMGLLTDVYTDQYDMMFNENGTLAFKDGDGNITQFSDLPDYFNKDYKTGDAIQKMAADIYKSGQPFNPATKMMHRNKLQSMVEQGGIETLYSLANDDFFNMNGLGIPDEVLKNPERRDEVEDMVIDQYLNVLEQQAASGSVYNKNKTKKKEEELGDAEFFNQDQLNYIDNVIPTLPMETNADVITAWSNSGILGTKYKLIPDNAGGFVVQAIHGRRRDWNVGTMPKTDYQGFMDTLKRNGIKPN